MRLGIVYLFYIAKKFWRVIDQYIDHFNKEDTLCVLEGTLNLPAKEMMEHMSECGDDVKALPFIFGEDEGGYEEIIHLFRILEKILNLCGNRFSEDCREFFAESGRFPPHDLYDKLEYVLDAHQKRHRMEIMAVLAIVEKNLKQMI